MKVEMVACWQYLFSDFFTIVLTESDWQLESIKK